jgi:membrane fusion protein (multidrug efflux system)
LLGAEDVRVMARVPGFLERQLYVEGAYVRRGQPLFVIDQRELRTASDQAKASVAAAEALLARQTAQVNRMRPLAAQNAVSKLDLDNAEAAYASALAQLDGAKAALQKASLDLGYAEVRSPIDGIAGSREVDVGTFVGSPQPTVLATVSDVDPVRVTFGISEREYLELARTVQAGARNSMPVELILADGSVHTEKGRVTVVGRGVETATGTLPIQATFPNPRGLLRPGQFGRVRVQIGTAKSAVVVPQRAVQELQGTYTVAIVKADDTVEIRPVEVGSRTGTDWVISKGLQAGERVVIDGVQKARAGAKVKPTTGTTTATDSTSPEGPTPAK